MTGIDLQTLAPVLAGRLLNTAVEGLILAGLVWLLLRFSGRQNSGSRFAIWFLALLVIVALPFFPRSALVLAHSGNLSQANPHGEIVLAGSWDLYFLAAWSIVAGLLLLRLSVGLWRVRRLRRSFSDVKLSALDPGVVITFRDLARYRRVRFCVSDEVAAPAAIGFFRPAIVLPAWLLPQLSSEEVKVILVHELAHLRRWDDWTNLAQKIVKALFFFHPAVWWIENRLTLEREMACDDIVLSHTASPKVYASSLISFAEKLQHARTLALAQALVNRMCHLSQRVRQILDDKRSSGAAHWKPLVGLSAGMLAVVFGAAPYAPQLIAFQSHATENQLRQTEVAQLPVNIGTHAEILNANRASADRTAKVVAAKMSNPAPEAREIPAEFNPRAAAPPLPLKQRSRHKPIAVRTKLTRRELPNRATFVVVQTAQFDDSGAGVWTLCIWRVGGNLAERQLESAIIVSSI